MILSSEKIDRQPSTSSGRTFQAVATLLVSLFLYADCDSKPVLGHLPTSEQTSRANPRCPSISGISNLSLSDISPEALPYLKKYSLPTADAAEFCRYLERLQREHESKIEKGLIDMMGDYFWTTQTIETNYLFSYKLGRPSAQIPQIILDRPSSEDEMVVRFMRAIDDDKDVKRKTLFDAFIQKLSSPDQLSREEGTRKLMKFIFEKSWVFNSEFQQSARDAGVPTTYGFAERGLRTTTPITVAAQVDQFLSSKTAKQFLPEKISRVLIIGPGLQLSDPDVGQAFPQQSHEPFTLIDSLVRSGKATLDGLRVDLLDINPRVVEYFKNMAASAEPYFLHIVMNEEEVPEAMLDYGRTVFGTSLAGSESSIPIQGKSLRPSRGRLEPAPIISRSLRIPGTILKKLHPYQGDMATTDLEKIAMASGQKYDAIFCFDTLIYLSETERMLAGISIRKALTENGVFVTDNRLETDTGERPALKKNPEKPSLPIFDASFFQMVADYNHADGSNMGSVENEGRRSVVYRRGK